MQICLLSNTIVKMYFREDSILTKVEDFSPRHAVVTSVDAVMSYGDDFATRCSALPSLIGIGAHSDSRDATTTLLLPALAQPPVSTMVAQLVVAPLQAHAQLVDACMFEALP